MAVLSHLDPALVWKHFEALCAIPRISKHESQAAAYVEEQCRKAGLSVLRDGTGNVVARKPASASKVAAPVVILQSHLDMVPQKRPESNHDFLRDPILPWIDGEWVRARDTTLGADNGIGAACALAVLESKNLEHAPIEALFTLDEETGMSGALKLQADLLQGRRMINIDTEEEDELCIGCAGGVDVRVSLPLKHLPTPPTMKMIEITVRGLLGGHSGLDINLGRANAIRALSRVLVSAVDTIPFHLCSFTAGSVRNAIPREATAMVACAPSDVRKLEVLVQELSDQLRSEFGDIEPGCKCTIAESPEIHPKMIESASQLRFLQFLHACPNGVIRMSSRLSGMVETSTNLAIVSAHDQAEAFFLVRSDKETARDEVCRTIGSIARLANGTMEISGGYPGWAPQPKSPVVELMRSAHREVYGKDPHVVAVHAGLECGIIGSIYPGMDMVSCGPTIRFPHSPDEKLHIPSVGRFWQVLVRALAKS